MAFYRTYQCPHCEGIFDYLHHPNSAPPPKTCQLCGADVSGKKKRALKKRDRVLSPGLADRVKAAHRPGRRISESVDSVYRGMENAAQSRMEDAAQLLGCDPKSLSAMKLTDMKDNTRTGDISVQSHQVSEATKLTGGATTSVQGFDGKPINMNFQNNEAAAEYARATRTGPHPFAGNTIREMVTSTHSSRAQSVARAGQINKG